jgi:hypothetical protein
MTKRTIITILLGLAIGAAGVFAGLQIKAFLERPQETTTNDPEKHIIGTVFFANSWHSLDEQGVIQGVQEEHEANAYSMRITFATDPVALDTTSPVQIFSPASLVAMEKVLTNLPADAFTAQRIEVETPFASWFSVVTTQNVRLLFDWHNDVAQDMQNLRAALASDRYLQGNVTSIDLRFGQKVFIK